MIDVQRTHVVVVRLQHTEVSQSARAATTRALLAQTYPDWSAVDGPAEPGPPGLLRLPADPARPSEAADVVVLTVPEGGVLHQEALSEVVGAVRSGARLVTWDLDVVDSVDGHSQPWLRFGWSPEVLLSADYTHGCFALQLPDYLAAAEAAAVPHEELTSWGLLLRLPEDLHPTRHLAQALATIDQPEPVPDPVAAAVITAGLRHRGVPADCLRHDGVTRLDWQREQWPSVTLIVPTRHNEAMIGPLFESLRLTDYPGFDVLVMDNGEQTPAHREWYDRDWGFPLTVRWWQEAPFHYGRVNNAAADQVRTEVIVLLNDDTRVLDPGWLRELVGLASLPGVGCVGSVLLTGLTGEATMQHAGVWLGIGGYAGHLFGGLAPGVDTLLGPTSWYRNTLAVTAACLAIRRDTYLAIAGLDERMVLCGSDVTLGLDLVARGLRNICSPLPGVAHLESVTRSSAPLGDQLVSLLRYQTWHDRGDPYGNPRLSLRSTRPRFAAPGELDPIRAAREEHGVVV